VPFTLCIRGLTISVLEAAAVRNLLLHSGYDRVLGIPHHLPTLVLPRNVVASSDIAPLPTLRGRAALRELEALDSEQLDRDYVGWDLTGLTVAAGVPGAPTQSGGTLAMTHPEPAEPDWSDLHWVIDVNRFQPGAKVKPAAFSPGAITSAVVELRGGAVAGGVPSNGEDANWVWFFSPGITQAVTDTITWTVAEETSFSFADSRGPRGSIVVRGQQVGYLVNEATAADIRREIDLYRSTEHGVTTPIARHALAYLSALELPSGKTPFTPVALYNFSGINAWENATCVPVRA